MSSENINQTADETEMNQIATVEQNCDGSNEAASHVSTDGRSITSLLENEMAIYEECRELDSDDDFPSSSLAELEEKLEGPSIDNITKGLIRDVLSAYKSRLIRKHLLYQAMRKKAVSMATDADVLWRETMKTDNNYKSLVDEVSQLRLLIKLEVIKLEAVVETDKDSKPSTSAMNYAQMNPEYQYDMALKKVKDRIFSLCHKVNKLEEDNKKMALMLEHKQRRKFTSVTDMCRTSLETEEYWEHCTLYECLKSRKEAEESMIQLNMTIEELRDNLAACSRQEKKLEEMCRSRDEAVRKLSVNLKQCQWDTFRARKLNSRIKAQLLKVEEELRQKDDQQRTEMAPVIVKSSVTKAILIIEMEAKEKLEAQQELLMQRLQYLDQVEQKVQTQNSTIMTLNRCLQLGCVYEVEFRETNGLLRAHNKKLQSDLHATQQLAVFMEQAKIQMKSQLDKAKEEMEQDKVKHASQLAASEAETSMCKAALMLEKERRDKVENELKTTLQDTLRNYKEMQEKNAELNMTVESLRVSLEASNKQNIEFKKMVDSLQGENSRLEIELGHCQQAMKQKDLQLDEFAVLLAENYVNTGALIFLKENVEALKAERDSILSSSQRDKKEAQEKIEELEKTIEGLHESLARVQAKQDEERKELLEEVKKLKMDLEHSQHEASCKEKENNHLKEKLEKAEQTLEENALRLAPVEDLKDEKDEETQTFANQSQEGDDSKGKGKTWEDKFQNARAENLEKDAKIKMTQEELELSKAKIKELQAALEKERAKSKRKLKGPQSALEQDKEKAQPLDDQEQESPKSEPEEPSAAPEETEAKPVETKAENATGLTFGELEMEYYRQLKKAEHSFRIGVEYNMKRFREEIRIISNLLEEAQYSIAGPSFMPQRPFNRSLSIEGRCSTQPMAFSSSLCSGPICSTQSTAYKKCMEELKNFNNLLEKMLYSIAGPSSMANMPFWKSMQPTTFMRSQRSGLNRSKSLPPIRLNTIHRPTVICCNRLPPTVVSISLSADGICRKCLTRIPFTNYSDVIRSSSLPPTPPSSRLSLDGICSKCLTRIPYTNYEDTIRSSLTPTPFSSIQHSGVIRSRSLPPLPFRNSQDSEFIRVRSMSPQP